MSAIQRWMRAAALAPLFALIIGLSPHTPPAAIASHTADPTAVTIASDFQSELGCPGDWQADCAITRLEDRGNGVWRGEFSIPPGAVWQYKAALNERWDESYAGNHTVNGNTTLDLSAAAGSTPVRFYYDHKTHAVLDSVMDKVAVAAGSFQSELGCTGANDGDWQPWCVRTLLTDVDGDGIYTFATTAIPPGSYAFKVALDEDWATAFPGSDMPLIVGAEGEKVVINWNSLTNEVSVGELAGNLTLAKAHWVTRDTIAWSVTAAAGTTYTLHYDPTGALTLTPDGVAGGQTITLTRDPAGLSAAVTAKFPHLRNYQALKIAPADLGIVPTLLKGQIAVSATAGDGALIDATALQIPGVLDDIYAYDGPLGVTYAGGAPTLRVWAPTARSVTLHRFADAATPVSTTVAMTLEPATGVWSAPGSADWSGQFYLYEVEVFVRATGQVERNLVTDPYSISLATNSTRSQIIDLDDPALKPAGWESLDKPALYAPEDIVLYELHVRDFSINDTTVAEAHRGTFLAFTETNSAGMRHLRALARAGLTHLHLLPVFDFATVNENRAERVEPDWAELAALPGDSPEQQAIIAAIRDQDGFNWGYDPFHYGVPEGSYATDPNGAARIREFRAMVQALNQQGLRVVMDVVYNHTTASGQNERSVLDRVVPGYYHRLGPDGSVERSTCCDNTATEHVMMEKLMLDTVRIWATDYKVDGFRFDLMGHHMVSNMLNVRTMLDSLTLAEDGVDGTQIYVYGEGWNFGEVANNARGINATQLNMAGTGIGSFNDRIRDAIRGGGPFSGLQEQGFINGLFYDPNATNQGSLADQEARLLLYMDRIRVGLAGNLRDYAFIDRNGALVTGAAVDYNGSPTGYTLDPQEVINYAEAHDNETLFDAIQFKAPLDAAPATRVRMINLGNSLIALSQGIPFFHAGQDMLRSKSLDRDSYNSGDWFNKLDFTYTDNNWAVGLPPAEKNQSNWPLMQPLLANPALQTDGTHIVSAVDHFRELLLIRRSSPLFRLRTAEEIGARLAFLNTGPEQTRGLIVMHLNDEGAIDVDPDHEHVVVLFNASDEAQTFRADELADRAFRLHPIQARSADATVRTASYDAATGVFSVPARTTAVFVVSEYTWRLPIIRASGS